MQIILSFLFIVVMFSGCKENLNEGVTISPPASFEFDESELVQLKTIQSVSVDKINKIDNLPFHATKRDEKIKQFPCSSCHDAPLRKTRIGDIDNRQSHIDIQLKHASDTMMNCQTCHNYKDMQTLVLLNTEPLDFNHSYQLCSQCHFEQARDWAGGAHGKRLAGWQGKRVVFNCTDCHNPHSPAFDKRWPLQFPTIPRNGKN